MAELVYAHDSKSCAARLVGSSPTSGTTMKRKVLIIVGPTASGKSALAVALAKKFNGEIISADSRQVYRGLDIGTGKVTKKEMGGVKHHLLDVASPKKKFSAGDFSREARKAISMIYHTGKLPIICGGTGFYIDSLIGRISLPEVPPNAALRAQLSKRSAAKLFEILREKSPERARQMDTPSERNNKVRLIRALEVAAAKQKSKAESGMIYHTDGFDALWIGIAPPLRELERKITARLHARIRRGMIAEAKRLRKAGLSYKRMEELGLEYRSLARHLRGEISKEEMIAELERDIRRYAKKQLVYWKRNTDIAWFTPADRKISTLVERWLKG